MLGVNVNKMFCPLPEIVDICMSYFYICVHEKTTVYSDAHEVLPGWKFGITFL